MNGEYKKTYLLTEDKENSTDALNIKQRQLRRSESSEYEWCGKAANTARIRLRRTKHALILSMSSLAICFAMLVSSTFAWLSDKAQSKPIVATAGNLEIDLLQYKAADSDYVSVANGEVFDPDFKWEPGATQIVYLAVENKGTLASKFNVMLTVNDGGLADSLEYLVLDDSTSTIGYNNWDDLKARYESEIVSMSLKNTPKTISLRENQLVYGNVEKSNKDDKTVKYYVLAVHMKDGIENNYMDKWINLDISVHATQAQVQGDSFGSLYDENAELPKPHTFAMGNVNNAIRWGEFVERVAGSSYKTDVKKVVFGRWSEQKNNLTEKEFSKGIKVAYGTEDSDLRAFYEGGVLFILTGDNNGMIQAPRNMGNAASGMFMDWTGLSSVDFSYLDTSEVIDMQNLFNGCTNLTEIKWGRGIGTSNVANMRYMFNNCSGLLNVDLNSFNTSNVTHMSYMFNGCSTLTDLVLSSFDTSKVIDMSNMFCGCKNLSSIEISPHLFNTGAVTKMVSMFDGCEVLENLDISGFDVSSVKTMQRMFFGCKSLQTLDLSGFNTESVESMQAMFRDCSRLTSISFGSGFNTSGVTTMQGMFNNCQALNELDLTSFYTPNVTSMQGMFRNCKNLQKIYVTPYSGGSSGFTVANLTASGSSKEMFLNCTSINSDRPDDEYLKKYDPESVDKSYAFIGYYVPLSNSVVPGYFRAKE